MMESRWFAYELHDGLMQWVIGARMHMASLVAAIKEGRHPTDNLENELSQILRFLNQATDEGRQLIRFVEGLPGSDRVDVVEILANTCELLTRKTQAGKPVLKFHPPENAWPELAVERAWPIVRIIQQAVLNAVRHSQAERIDIRLQSSDTQLIVTVQDDGCGFDVDLDRPGHFGLKSMRSRAKESGLQLSIESSAGVGSLVRLIIPILGP